MTTQKIRGWRVSRDAVLALIAVWSIACGTAGPEPSPATSGDAGTGPVTDATTIEPWGPACSVDPPSEPLVVATRSGLVRGREDQGTVSFRGIPFASPPVGDLRFRAPEPTACWDGVRDATEYASPCVQIAPNNGTFGREDCLYLNLWTPDLAPTSAPRPVLLWIYGGAGIIGSGNQDLVVPFFTGNVYDGHSLAATQDAIVVTFNYRLGELGYLAHPTLGAENEHGSSGNYAIQDHIAALRWVHDNIAQFGGDPNRVTIFGESFGGVSVAMLLASPLAKGLFSSAIIESGGFVAGSLEQGYDRGNDAVSRVGCATAADIPACLRSKPAFAFVNTVTTGLGFLLEVLKDFDTAFSLGPIVDGHVIEEPPLRAMRTGRFNDVPVIIGTNADETELFTGFGLLPTLTCIDYGLELQVVFRDRATVEAVKAMYPCTWASQPHKLLVEVTTDWGLRCPARRGARAAHAGGSPVYRYMFRHRLDNPILASLRSFHALEVPFVFNSFDAFSIAYTPKPDELALSASMQNYWGQFARTAGDPNGTESFTWPRFDPATDDAITFDVPLATERHAIDPKCDFWDRYAIDD